MFKLTIETMNAAFEGEDGTLELARILREMADDFENGFNGRDLRGPCSAKVRDLNGNTVGNWEFR